MWIERANQQATARREWLDDAVQRWVDDDEVVGAWLWGSEGVGTADELSDFDLFVILGDDMSLGGVEDRFAAFGEVLRVREVPYNAPEGGRYFSVS